MEGRALGPAVRVAVKRAAKLIVGWLSYLLGITALVRRHNARSGRAVIVLFHRTNDLRDPFARAIPSRAFRRHLEYLKRFHQVVSLRELTASLVVGGDIAGLAAVTFDDGYRDNWEVAFPILHELACPATVFVTTEALDNAVPLWTEEVRESFRHSSRREFYSSVLQRSYSLGGTRNRAKSAIQFAGDLKEVPDAVRQRAIDEMRDILGTAKVTTMVRWVDLRAMLSPLVEIGSHTATHPCLDKLTDGELEGELTRSRAAVASLVGGNACGLSYPSNAFDERVKVAARKAGYLWACAVGDQLVARDADLFALPRVTIHHASLPMFAAEVEGVFSWLRRHARQLVRPSFGTRTHPYPPV